MRLLSVHRDVARRSHRERRALSVGVFASITRGEGILHGMERDENEVTRILRCARGSEALSDADRARLFELTYAELRRLAGFFMS